MPYIPLSKGRGFTARSGNDALWQEPNADRADMHIIRFSMLEKTHIRIILRDIVQSFVLFSVIFLYYSIVICMNFWYTMCGTFKEVLLCIERLLIS